MAKKKTSTPSPSSPPKETYDIPEDEQWRIIKETGILEGMTQPSTLYRRNAPAKRQAPKIEEIMDSDEEREKEMEPFLHHSKSDAPRDNEDEDEAVEDEEVEGEEDLPDQIFQAAILVMPLATLFILMD